MGKTTIKIRVKMKKLKNSAIRLFESIFKFVFHTKEIETDGNHRL